MIYLGANIELKPILSIGFNCLYILEHPNFFIVEIKRTDLAIDADMGIRYQWLKINKKDFEVNHLNFRSTDSATQIEERFFDEGYLKFNANNGTFIEKYNSAQYQLERKNNYELPKKLSQTVNNYLRMNALAS